MSELTIEIDNWGHKELDSYLRSINGILDLKIENDKVLKLDIKYDDLLINDKVILMELNLFLDLGRVASIISFDKHPKMKTESLTIKKKDICCEYCFKGAIEELYNMDGIEKITSEYADEYFMKCYEDRDDLIIEITYDPKRISKEKVKELEKIFL